ncbi:hypothetical protein HaLaN_27267 [Haematococcus lacustris]|uniref:Uncharacterized protein n=1 Tax=Haematococcus lacustris TaxID=44745 RepID=A0A6A0A861_HAELA|nr:hypothetical protein HaLaN_27267 [Haematococcus lacustris]
MVAVVWPTPSSGYIVARSAWRQGSGPSSSSWPSSGGQTVFWPWPMRQLVLMAAWLRPSRQSDPKSGLDALNKQQHQFYNGDVSAALDIRCCVVGPGPRPTELCRWEGHPAMPKLGQPCQEWVYVRDIALLRKWRRKWRQ